MDSRFVEQGTTEWHEARKGRINASELGAILDCSPFSSRKRMLKNKVSDAPFYTSAAMQWGKDNEDRAGELYTFLRSAPDEKTEKTGYWTIERDGVLLGASPDLLVGDEGLVEIKCPYRMVEEESPEFDSIEKLHHYWHQIQLQLLATDRQWCDFFQWAPSGFKCERVERDPDWWDTVKERVILFYADYKKALETQDDPDPVGSTSRFRAAAEDYTLAKLTRDMAQSDMDAAKKVMTELCEESSATDASGWGVSLSYVERKGSVNYKAIATKLAQAGQLEEMMESSRGKTTASWRITVTGDEQ